MDDPRRVHPLWGGGCGPQPPFPVTGPGSVSKVSVESGRETGRVGRWWDVGEDEGEGGGSSVGDEREGES